MKRRQGRLSPTNGSVTRSDIEAIYAECARGADPPPTGEEFRDYLLGAITDWTPTTSQRARIAAAAASREARRREERIEAAAQGVMLETRRPAGPHERRREQGQAKAPEHRGLLFASGDHVANRAL